MKKSRHSKEKVISILREAQGGTKVKEVRARHNISPQTYQGWKRKYGEMQVDEAFHARVRGG
ncbi:MAG: transposase [Verrucomicrobiaceae bacterium]